MAFFWLATIAQAETYTVTTKSDTSAVGDGELTLREAIALANTNEEPDTIHFAEDLSGEIITLTQGQLEITDDLSIDASALEEAPSIDADGKSRVMGFRASGGNLELNKLTLCNGHPVEWIGSGAGLLFDSTGELIITNATFKNNSTSSYGGNGGGILLAEGSLTVRNSQFIANSAGRGGGIWLGS